jgi:N-methylhydantoinase A
MRRAIGVMTLERGQDPRGLPLLCFGGAGGLHAAALARELGMPLAVVPRHPGALSAWGMTRAEAGAEISRPVLEPLSRWSVAARRAVFDDLAREAREALAEQPGRGRVVFERELDLRYRGQSYELRMPESARVATQFHAAHKNLYGYALDAREVELIGLRIRATRRRPSNGERRVRPLRSRAMPTSAVIGSRRAAFGDRPVDTAVIDRNRLAPGHRFEGPALVEEFSGTTLVPPGTRARVLRGGHLALESD